MAATLDLNHDTSGIQDLGTRRRLLIFLSIATFFEGYDFLALAQILPALRADMGLDQAQAGWLLGGVNVGTVAAFLLVRQADRRGRRPVMVWTILGYTLFTGLTALCTGPWTLAVCQAAARLFLIAEWATSMVYAAESFPAAQRATVIGVIQAFSSLGSVVCAGVVPLLLKTSLGWRAVYLVGVVPLLVLAFARRDLPETPRFVAAQAAGRDLAGASLTGILRSRWRTRVLQLSAIWAVTYLATQNAISFWKEFAMAERGFSDGEVGASIAIAAVGSMPLVFASGKLLDVVGRRRGASVIFVVTALAIVAAYSLHGRWPLTAALVFAIFGASAVLPVLNSYTAELFPTSWRGDAFAWANNLLGRTGYVLGPILVGQIAAAGLGWGLAVSLTAFGPVLALAMLLAWLPETRGASLESITGDAEA